VFFSHHESDNEDGFKILNNSDLPKKQIYLVNNNYKLNEYVNEYNSQIKIYSVMYLPVVVSSTLYNLSGTKFSFDKKERFFMCFNRGPKTHRYSLLVFMLKHNLLDESNWSFIPNFFFIYDFENYNQIFARDIGFVIGDTFVKSNILPERERELDAIQYILDQIDPQKVVRPPAEVHIEGGDVMLWKDYVFIGTYKGSDYKEYITARTNLQGVQYIKDLFPSRIVKEFDLVKSKIEARDNALHLDCCFQPVGVIKNNLKQVNQSF
jgi:hypothetical protein